MIDDLTLFVTNSGVTRQLSGWTSVRVTRGCERLPADFDIAMTERFPGEFQALVVQPGDGCRVAIGNDSVVTGYIDRFMPFIAGNVHGIRVLGRGKCADLVDCSAEWGGSQISGNSVLGIAQKLVSPYRGLSVSLIGADVGNPIPQFNIIWGETPFSIIQRLAQYHALLAYDGTDGNLILSRVGTGSAACGFTQGINVEAAAATFSMDQRYSDYVVRTLPMNYLGDITTPGKDIIGNHPDKGVPRHRLRYILAEQVAGGPELANQRAAWEAARRFGRSWSVMVTTDVWRDSAGALWTPNTLVPLDLPALKISGVTWVIGDVTYLRDEHGTRAVLTIMPREAFEPQPTLVSSFQADVWTAAQG